MKTCTLKSFPLHGMGTTVSLEIDDDHTVRLTRADTYEDANYNNSLGWMNSSDLRILAKKLKKLADKLDQAALGG
jgi:hypothetical protein